MEKISLDYYAIVPISSLTNWDKNPRAIREEDFARLKIQIVRHKQYKPLVVNDGKLWGKKGDVLGGNMRLRAHIELKTPELLVSWVSPKDEEEAIAIALSDNEIQGYYQDEKLAELLLGHPDFPMEDYRVNLAESIRLDEVTARFAPTDEAVASDEDTLSTDQLANWANSTVRQIVLFFTIQEFETTMKRLEVIQEKLGTTNNTETVLALLSHYENNNKN